MLKGRGWFGGGGLWRKNPHSLDHLRYLYNVLSKNQVVQESNRGLLVETLRSIAEILIWGDQNDSSVFDFFLEKNMLSFFLPIMKQKCGSYVCVQLLQTLNILFENIRNETSLYYLLSNNHVNSIIVHKFDFSDEEVMAYYISFLKTLSLKLNAHTIHFFYNEHTNDFPLYTEAIKFFNHPESMVRIAVRTLTLNVYRVNDQSMLQFIRDRTAAPYFSNLVWFIGNHILELENCVRSDVDHNSRGRLEDLVAEHLDHLHYINDILKLNISTLNAVLADHLLNRLLVPLLVYSLNPRQEKDERPRISSVVALFLLAQVFLIVSHAPLVRALAKIIFHGDNSIFAEDSQVFKGHRFVRRGFVAPEEPLEKSLQARTPGGSGNTTPLATVEEPSRGGRAAAAGGGGGGREDVNCEDHIGISDLAATHVNITDEEKEMMRATTTTTTTTAATTSSSAVCVSESEEDEGKGRRGRRGGGEEEEEEEEEEEKETPAGGGGGLTNLSLISRPFLLSTINALSCSGDDYSSLFALCLLYALGHNQGINQELLGMVVGGRSTTKTAYDSLLVDKMLEIITLSCQYNSKVRVATLEMAILVLKQLVGVGGPASSGGGGGSRRHTYLRDNHLASLEGAKEEATLMLRNFYKSEEIFLDMFEDEWVELHRRPLNVEYLLQDASVLLPPAGTPLTGIDFNKRLPCGEVERARRAMRVFFLVREVSLAVREENDPHLPLTNPAACVQVADVLDLNNSDLIACVVIPRDGQRTKRFLVIDVIQLILVEPDLRRLGWGVAKFVGFLQDLEVTGDKDDSRVLHLTIHRPSASSGRPSQPLLAAKFIFDDHIRCMAAKQRLIKGRMKARQKKLHQIARLLELPSHLQPCPSPPAHALHTMRQEAHRQRLGRVDARSRSANPHRSLFNVSVVPGFALKKEGENRHDETNARTNVAATLSPGRTSRQVSRQSHTTPSSSSSSSTSSSSPSSSTTTQQGERGGRGARSTSRPRPRSEEIPLEDIITAGSLPHLSLSLPKVNIGGHKTPSESTPELPPPQSTPADPPQAPDSPPEPPNPPEETQKDSKEIKRPSETETSFSAPLLSPFDVFEPRVNGQVEGGGQEVCQPPPKPRGSLGSADFSPIRKGRLKGSVETV